MFIFVLYLLRCFLETGEHGTLAAGHVFARVAALADLAEHVLDQCKLIGAERIIVREVLWAAEALHIKARAVKGEKITQLGIRRPRAVQVFQLHLIFRLFLQDTFLNHLVHRRRGQAETRFEAGLNSRELIGAHLDDLINGFLPGANYPHFAATFASDLFSERLQIQQHVRICPDVLSDLIYHKQQAEIARLFLDVSSDVFHETGDRELDRRLVMEPAFCVLLAHVQNFHQRRNNRFPIEGKGFALLKPGLSLLLLKYATEFLRLAKLINILLQHGDFQVFSIEPEVIIKHLGKNPENGRLVLDDGTFDVNIEKDGLSLPAGRPINIHESTGIFGKFAAEEFYCSSVPNLPVLQKIG